LELLSRWRDALSEPYENVRYWDEADPSALIRLSQGDFEAAKILFERRLYPQAIYMLQQSLEKAVKALLLKMNIVRSEEELKSKKKGIGHDVVKKTLELLTNKLEEKIKEVPRIFEQLRGGPRELQDLAETLVKLQRSPARSS
jgi:HEPN domain-containing protein